MNCWPPPGARSAISRMARRWSPTRCSRARRRGQGGSAHGDGKSALLDPTSAANTAVELLEARASILVLGKSFVTDSGGPGRYRGGLGVRTRLRKLHDDGLPTLAAVYPERAGVTVAGLRDGGAGGDVHGVVLDPADNVLHDCGTGELVTLTRADQIVEIQLAGGGGYGDPHERLVALIERDVAEGYVPPEAAQREYGLRPAAERAAE